MKLFKRFTWYKVNGTVNLNGRPVPNYVPQEKRISCAIVEATQKEKEQFKQSTHPISHKLVQKKKAIAAVGDKLTIDKREFFIQTIGNPGEFDLFTTYYAEER